MVDLTISQAAKILGVHKNTLWNYERRGLISPARDVHGYRRYTVEDIKKVKSYLTARWPSKYSEKNRNYPETQENDESTKTVS